MLTPPELPNAVIAKCLNDAYGLRVSKIEFLPIGADMDTAVFCVTSSGGVPYFLKLRRGNFDEVDVAVPAALHHELGISSVMAPLPTVDRQLWTRVQEHDAMLYPFVDGVNGFESALSGEQWVALGAALGAVHAAILPSELQEHMPREDFAPRWRNSVKRFDSQLSRGNGDDGDDISRQFASLWQSQRDEIDTIVSRAEALAHRLDDRSSAFVVCHADIHAGNVLVGPGGELSIVDWDTVILAPKERDLMFVGGGVGGVWNQTQEQALFYQGYGPTNIDPVALAYYRYERIVVDLAEFREQLFDMDASADEHNEGLKQMASQFRPNNVVDIAHRTWRRIV